jgi:hypothetical protein
VVAETAVKLPRSAISDSPLIGVFGVVARPGFRLPEALTAAWVECIAVPPGVVCEGEAGRLWDVLFLLRCATGQSGSGSEVRFGAHTRNDDREGTPPLVRVKALCAPGDGGEPVVTVMLPEED